ncbi:MULTISPECIES: lipoprotein LpqH [Mycobacteroides]|uniref:lipoprotein LpqH n=1 Tax=Mycobacteroides TaxID=670516 RepID=UPI0013EF7403|nr:MULTISPECIES: lipoprotein LpqH [Mycobacteroides]
MDRPQLTLAIALAAVICFAGCSARPIAGQATTSPAPVGSTATQVTAVLDGETLALKRGPICIGDGKNILILARIEGTDDGKVTADVGITEPLAVHTVLIKGLNSQDYFWEPSPIRPDDFTATKSGRTVTITGEIRHRDLKNKTNKRIEIQAKNCPGT